MVVLEETILNNSSDNGKVKPGLKIALAYVLKTASKIMKASFLMDDKDEEAAEIDKFVAVLNLNHNYVFGDAQYLLQKGRQIKSQAWNPTPGFGLVFGLVLVYWGLTPQQQPGSYQGGEMMMKSVFWWRKPEHPEETTDPWQVTDETFHTYGLCPVRGLNLGRSGVKQSELRRDESGALARRATAVPLLPQEADVQKVRTYTVETVKGLLKDEYMQWSAHEYIKLRDLIVCRLTLFNARRGGEPSRLLLSEWVEANSGSWVGTKRLVLVLIPKDMVDGIRKLADENLRNDVGVQKNNVYLLLPNNTVKTNSRHVQAY